ncbi:MAG: ABC transporter ATP-binding protein [Candidatus Hydrogenedentes bacterium]|nr:ABC transporter ATP-binding protein [Candidatus Hydrogenedentota bacterium]
MANAISIANLSKRYGQTQALSGLSLEVSAGDVCGLLGPNGAGKTTTMRILATLLRPDIGIASVLGHNVVSNPAAVRPLIGYMPDSSGAYRDMEVAEYLEFFAAAYDIPEAQRARIVDDCIALTGLMEKRDALIDGLSRGMQQRLGLARCLIHDPQVLILDEPASGLDPRARIEVLEVLRTLGQMGKTVLISSHILSELRHLCNTICIIDRGRLLYFGTIDEALKQARTAHRLEIRLTGRPDAARDMLAGLDGVRKAEVLDSHVSIELHDGIEDFSFVASRLVEAGFGVLTIKEEEILLEDAFLRLTDDAQQATHMPPPVPSAPPDRG